MTLPNFLMYLANSGGCIVVASWLLARIEPYENLTSDMKQYVFYLVSALIGILAYVTLTYVPVYIINDIAPFWQILAGVFATVILGTQFHVLDKNAMKHTIVKTVVQTLPAEAHAEEPEEEPTA